MTPDHEGDAPASVEPSADALREAVAREIACAAAITEDLAVDVDAYVDQTWFDYRDGADAILALPVLRATEERAKRAEAERDAIAARHERALLAGATRIEALAQENAKLREALEQSNELLCAILHEPRPNDEIMDQVRANRAALLQPEERSHG